MQAKSLSLTHLIRPPRFDLPRPPLLIVLHEQGGSEHSLFALADLFDERFLVLSPQGPFEAAGGGFTWLSPDASPANPYPNIAESCAQLLHFIQEALRLYAADPGQVYLFGFGQGGTLSLGAMVREPEMLAGVAVVDAQIPEEVQSIPVPNDRLSGFPVMLVRAGSEEEKLEEIDEILLALRTDLTRSILENFMIHSPELLTGIRIWLSQRLNQGGVSFMRRREKPATYAVQLKGVRVGVRSLDRSIAFYTRFLGMHLVERTGNAFAFLALDGASHHVVALENTGVQAPEAPADSPGLRSISFEASDGRAFALAYQALAAAGVRLRTVDHCIRWSLYFSDPDRNGIEIYWDTRDLPGGSSLWQGRDQPLEAASILALLHDALPG
jgi:catechol 2,3-dioxygenase